MSFEVEQSLNSVFCVDVSFRILRSAGANATSSSDINNATLEEPDDMDWARSVQASAPKVHTAFLCCVAACRSHCHSQLKLPDAGRPTLKLLSLACIMLPPPLPSTPGDPLRRGTHTRFFLSHVCILFSYSFSHVCARSSTTGCGAGSISL